MQATSSFPAANRDSAAREGTRATKMNANVFHGKDEIRVEEVEKPRAGVW